MARCTCTSALNVTLEPNCLAFNAGTHHELIRLSYEDLARLVKPNVAQFSTSEEPALRL